MLLIGLAVGAAFSFLFLHQIATTTPTAEFKLTDARLTCRLISNNHLPGLAASLQPSQRGKRPNEQLTSQPGDTASTVEVQLLGAEDSSVSRLMEF